MAYIVVFDVRGLPQSSRTMSFGTRKDALKYAYRNVTNFNASAKIGVDGANIQGKVVCIHGKRFYVLFKENGTYGREYSLHSDGTLGE